MTHANRFPWWPFGLVLLTALIARGLLLASGTVSFHSDEAVVGLMSRHILQGARPVFFYGQAYMGSLDAWLIATGFRFLGDSVFTIRVVQSVLYLLVVASGFIVAWRFSHKALVATTAGLLLAVPAVNTALYTTATLGGYNETLLLGNSLLLLAYAVTHHYTRSWWRWTLLGICAGLGWWTNGLIIVYILPVTLLIAYALFWKRSLPLIPTLPFILLALVAFFVGSAPWWVFDFTHDHAALGTFIRNRQVGEFEGIGIPYTPPSQRALGLIFIGFPALFGLRFPWDAAYFLPLIGVPLVLIYVAAIIRLLRGENLLQPDARGLVLGMIGLFCVIFVASTFGADPTGRYFLPLTLPFGILLGVLAESVYQTLAKRPAWLRRLIAALLVGLVVAYHGLGQITAAASDTGLTTQFDPVSHLSNAHDADLIAFLEANDLQHGYTNYWVAFRLAFLSDERLQYSSSLPYKTNLSYNPADNRYAPFTEQTAAAERVAYITSKLPELDAQLADYFADGGYAYRTEQIGPFTIYYDFEPEHPQPPISFAE